MEQLILIARIGMMVVGFILMGMGIRNLNQDREGGLYILWGFILVSCSITK